MPSSSAICLAAFSSRWDRYLGMTAAMTQVPVPTAIIKLCDVIDIK